MLIAPMKSELFPPGRSGTSIPRLGLIGVVIPRWKWCGSAGWTSTSNLPRSECTCARAIA
jgi:hypothetical protein